MRIHDYLDYWARRQPDALAVSDGRESLTWRQLSARSTQLAEWLSARLEVGARFAVLSKNSLDLLALYYAASRAQVVPVPLNVRLAPPEWAYILQDAGARLLLSEADFAAGLATIREGLLDAAPRDADPALGWAKVDVIARPGNVADSPTPGALYQMYTSGTTGLPKGVVVTQESACSNIVQLQTSLQLRQDRALIVMPLFHAGAVISAFTYLASGTSCYIMRDFEPAAVLSTFRQARISVVLLVPAMIQMLLDHPDLDSSPYDDLALMTYGGAPISTKLLRRAMAAFGCDFLQGYGMTETTSVATILDREDHALAAESRADLLLSCGRPAVGTEVRIVGGDGAELPIGQTGEVVLRGPQLMQAYWNRADATAAALQSGWLRTGDAGHLDEAGYLFLTDRVKDMIVSGGENIYPREIEEVLRRLEDVSDVAVIGIPDDRWGEVPLAFIVAQPAATLTAKQVVQHCRAWLAGFKCPRTVVFVEELPRNATGKVLKRELRAPYWDEAGRQVS